MTDRGGEGGVGVGGEGKGRECEVEGGGLRGVELTRGMLVGSDARTGMMVGGIQATSSTHQRGNVLPSLWVIRVVTV